MRVLICLMATLLHVPAWAQTLQTSAGTLKVDAIVSGLEEPWAMAFLPDGGMLITERGGRLLHVKDGQSQTVSGLPRVVVDGQGGLLDVLVPRDFEQTQEILWSHSARTQGGNHTAVTVARLSDDGSRVTNARRIFEGLPGSGNGRHFGSRLVEARDGTVFVTIGDRGDRPEAQNLGSHHGSVVRINRDGSVPSDNPFVGQDGARPEIWSYGHRNPQAAALDLNGNLIVVEHGARGGDEVNRVKRAGNFGWPVISYGTHYSGASIGEGTSKAGMEQPAFYWDPSMAPSGMIVYSGRLWPNWRGDLFVGSLKFDYISRLDGSPLAEREQIKGPETERVRALSEGPDGTIWFLSVGNGTLFRLSPG